MTQAPCCTECGSQLAPDELGELCPRCLLGAIADSTQVERSEATSPAADQVTVAPGGESNRGASPKRLPPLPGYELLNEVARGGMGVVYRARQLELDRIVAVKMMLSGRYASSDEIERFRVEAMAAAGLDHPSIVPIYEVREHDGDHFFSMAFVEGQSLDQRLVERSLAPKEAATLLWRITDAVRYAHRRQVVHRDLKPANILIDENAQPRITDFGLAKRLDAGSQLTATGQTLGTPTYMAPEQAAGKPDETGPAVDVYALGAILFAMLTGRPPFIGETPLATMMQVLEQEPLLPSQLNPKVDRDLDTICIKCLEKKPGDRYQSADELADDLKRYLDEEPIAARPLHGWRKYARWIRMIRRNRDLRLHSNSKIFGLPWLDVALGRDPSRNEETGRARGVVAIGDNAVGVFAFGSHARGVFAWGATAVGYATVGFLSIGKFVTGAFPKVIGLLGRAF